VPFGHNHQSAGFMLTKRFCRSGLCVRDENPPSGAERGVRRGVEPPKRTQRGSNGQFLGSHDGGSGRKNNRPLPGSAVAWPRCQIKGGVYLCCKYCINKWATRNPRPTFTIVQSFTGSCANFYHFTFDSYRRATTHRIHTPPAPRSSDFPLPPLIIPPNFPSHPVPDTASLVQRHGLATQLRIALSSTTTP